jgi:hypothetical protein
MLVLATREAEHFWIVAERSTEREKTKNPRNELKDFRLRSGRGRSWRPETNGHGNIIGRKASLVDFPERNVR